MIIGGISRAALGYVAAIATACAALTAVPAQASPAQASPAQASPAQASRSSCHAAPRAPPANPGRVRSALDGLAITSPCNAWAVGSYADGPVSRPLIEHWHGGRWSVQAAGARGDLTSVAELSPRQAWAVGSARHRILIERWTGTRWQAVRGGYTRWGGPTCLASPPRPALGLGSRLVRAAPAP